MRILRDSSDEDEEKVEENEEEVEYLTARISSVTTSMPAATRRPRRNDEIDG